MSKKLSLYLSNKLPQKAFYMIDFIYQYNIIKITQHYVLNTALQLQRLRIYKVLQTSKLFGSSN